MSKSHEETLRCSVFSYIQWLYDCYLLLAPKGQGCNIANMREHPVLTFKVMQIRWFRQIESAYGISYRSSIVTLVPWDGSKVPSQGHSICPVSDLCIRRKPLFIPLPYSGHNLVWAYNIANKLKSVVLQTRAVRNIAKVDYRAHTSPLFKKLDLLKVTDRLCCF